MGSEPVARFLRAIGLSSTRRGILAMVVTWILNLLWLILNYFWSLVGYTLLVTIPVILLVIALTALAAYIYWGMKDVKEKDAPYANVMVGVIIALTLLYFNYQFLQFILALSN